MANKDVSLVIRAKDQATKAVDSVADALRELTEIQNGVGQSANKADGLLGKLKNNLAALDREARGLAALNKVAAQLDKAADAVGRLDAAAGQATAELDKANARYAEAAARTKQLQVAAEQAKKAYDQQKAAVAALTVEQRKDKIATDAARASRDALKTAMVEANAALKTAVKAEQQLLGQMQQSERAAEESREALADANDELSEVAAIANRASAALGGVEATQAAVAAASARAARDMERLNAAMNQTTAGRAGPVTVTSTKGTLQDWRDAEAEVKRLAAAMRGVEQPTREMQTAMLVAQQTARTAKTAYTEQRLELARLSAARRDAALAARQEAAATVQTVDSQRRMIPAALSSGDAMGSAGTQGFRLRDAFRGIYGESRQAMNMFQRLRGEVLSLAASYVGLYGAIAGIGSVVTAFTQLEATQSRLGVVFQQNTARVAAEVAWLRGEANRLGVQFSTLSEEYGKFAIAGQAANFTAADTRRIFTEIAEAGRVMKVSQEDTAGLFRALTQIMSKGKVQAEELRGQLGDRMSGAFQIFAAAIGVTSAELDKMLEKGEVIADRGTLLKFADELDRRFGAQLPSAVKSLSAELGRFGNNLEQAQLQVAQGGFIDAFNESLREMNEWFVSDDGVKFFEGIGAALGKLVSIVPSLIQNIDKFVALFQVFVALKTSQVIMSLIGGMGGLSLATAKARVDVIALTLSMQMLGSTTGGVVGGAMTRVAGIMVGMRGAMIALAAAARTMWAAIGGLPGLLITGLTFVITHLVGKWLTSADKATEALNEHERILNKVREGYTRAAGDVRAWSDELKDLTATELELNTDKLRSELEDLRKQAVGVLVDMAQGLDLFTKWDDRQLLEGVIRQFSQGEISAAKFKAEIDRLAQANPNLDRSLIEPLIAVANKAAVAEKGISENAAATRALGGTATTADRQLLGLEDALAGVNAAADTSAIDAYTKALKSLGEAVPEIQAQLKFDDERKAIEDAYKQGLDALMARGLDSDALLAEMRVLQQRRTQALEALVREQATSGGGSYIDRLIGAESAGNPNARNSRSTATGLGQFTESTWLTLFRREFPAMAAGMTRAAILSLRTDPEMSRRMTELLTEQNAAMLAQAGFAATDTNKYLAHFLGPTDAIDVLRAAPNTPLDQLVAANSRAANPEVFSQNRTAGDLIAWSSRKMGGISDTQAQAQQQALDLLEQQRKAQAEYNAEIATGVSQRQFEIEQLGRTEREQVIQLALRQAETKAAEDRLTLSDAQRQAIVESTGALYDAQAAQETNLATEQARFELAQAREEVETRAAFIAREARAAGIDVLTAEGQEWARIKGLIYDVTEAERARKKEQETVDTNVSALQAQRDALMEQITFFQEQGQFGVAGELQTQLQGVNAELLKAIDAALAFYRALDPTANPNAAAAILGLQNMRNGLVAVNTTAITTGKQINDSIVNGATAAWDRFSDAVAEGKNVWESARDAFLQFAADFLREIARMIFQQMVLNAIGGGPANAGGQGGAGGAISNWINSLFRHDGGMVGSGGGYKSVWAGHFANATRYHSGGVVGLKPNEVPAILEKGEEVLDAGDPRHRANGGMGGSGPVNVKTVNLFDVGQLAAAMMADEVGQKVVLNWLRDNARAVSGAITT